MSNLFKRGNYVPLSECIRYDMENNLYDDESSIIKIAKMFNNDKPLITEMEKPQHMRGIGTEIHDSVFFHYRSNLINETRLNQYHGIRDNKRDALKLIAGSCIGIAENQYLERCIMVTKKPRENNKLARRLSVEEVLNHGKSDEGNAHSNYSSEMYDLLETLSSFLSEDGICTDGLSKQLIKARDLLEKVRGE